MLVSLIQRPTEVQLGRKTVLVDGRQIGFFHGANKPLIFTQHVDNDEAEAVKAEVEKIEGSTLGKCVIPAPTPPEWLEEATDESDEDE